MVAASTASICQRASKLALAILVLLCLLSVKGVSGTRGENGTLSLLIAVPLTANGRHIPDPGWFQMASALIAVDHFNDRDPAVVPELSELNCDLKFGDITVHDTETNGHQAKRLLDYLRDKGLPDAIAGPYNELPGNELSVLATGMESPIVACRGVDNNLLLSEKHPYFSQTNADLYGEMEFLGEYLLYIERTNYIAILYSSVDSVLQRLEVLRTILTDRVGADQFETFGYVSPATAVSGDPNRTFTSAMQQIKATGFRTIIMMTAFPNIDAPEVSVAAAALGMDQGEHFYIIPGGLDASSSDKVQFLIDIQDQISIEGVENAGFLRGSAYLSQIDPFEVTEDDKFLASFRRQNATFARKLISMNPIPRYFMDGWANITYEQGLDQQRDTDPVFPPDDFFRWQEYPTFSSSFMYDAVMSIGMGACLAAANQTNLSAMNISGEEHLRGIRASRFHGASGEVRFGNNKEHPGGRVGSTVLFSVYNVLPNGTAPGYPVQTSEYLDPETNKWVQVSPFVYSDGTTSPPELLRDTPEQNYLSEGVRIFGLTLMSIILLTTIVSDLWIFLHRKHSVVIASQPEFLYCLCFGSILMSLMILFFSFDESYGWSNENLDRACVFGPWLLALGHIVTYSALFTKLWRVNKVLQFRRARIKVRQVAWPALFLIVVAMAILSVWTATKDYEWERYVIDDVSGESIGRCRGDTTIAFLIPVGLLCLVPVALAAIMAWKTSDIDDIYSESKWIFTLILVHLQVAVIGLPVVVILQSVSSDGRYIGQCLLVFAVAMSTVGLIIFPKMFTVWRMKNNAGAQQSLPRGASARGTRISGLSGTSGGSTNAPTCTPITDSLANNATTGANNDPGMKSPGGVEPSRIQTVTYQ